VLTNGLSAEYGRLSGGAVILATRSGTNDFHGSGYEFFKNDMLNANRLEFEPTRQTKGVFHDNVFGFTFGGPVTIPKVYRGRTKLLFPELRGNAARYRQQCQSGIGSYRTGEAGRFFAEFNRQRPKRADL